MLSKGTQIRFFLRNLRYSLTKLCNFPNSELGVFKTQSSHLGTRSFLNSEFESRNDTYLPSEDNFCE